MRVGQGATAMTPAQWARVLGAGAGAANGLSDAASPAAVAVSALLAMKAEALKIEQETR
jgi:hypothetical protein